MAIFTGQETKIGQLRKHYSKTKTAKVDKGLDKVFLILIFVVFLVSLLHTLLLYASPWTTPSFESFLNFVLLYHFAVPFPLLFIRYIGRI